MNETELPTPNTAPPLAVSGPPATVPYLDGVVFATGTPKSLVKKLAQVMGIIRRVPKNGANTQQGYAYATEADIVAEVRSALAERSCMMVPTVVGAKWDEKTTKSGAQMKICTLRVRFTLFDGEAGESLSFEVFGQGEDTGDKATYKAMTGALKYALLKMFLIPTGDDPEHSGSIEPPAPKGTAALRASIHASQPSAGDAPKQPPAQAGHDREYVMPYANKQNLPLRELSDKDLAFYRKASLENIANPAKAQRRADNERHLALIDKEMADPSRQK